MKVGDKVRFRLRLDDTKVGAINNGKFVIREIVANEIVTLVDHCAACEAGKGCDRQRIFNAFDCESINKWYNINKIEVFLFETSDGLISECFLFKIAFVPVSNLELLARI